MPRFSPRKMPRDGRMRKLELNLLPEDLLAHVLRFATGSLRRDGWPGRPANVVHFRLASISAAFRRAFLRHLQSLVLDHPACPRLARMNWVALRSCLALRKVAVAHSARLTDAHLISLFTVLAERGIFLREFDVALSEDVTAVSLKALGERFGPYLTHLRVKLCAYPRSAHRCIVNAVNPGNVEPPNENGVAQNAAIEVAQEPLVPSAAENVHAQPNFFGEEVAMHNLGHNNPGHHHHHNHDWNPMLAFGDEDDPFADPEEVAVVVPPTHTVHNNCPNDGDGVDGSSSIKNGPNDPIDADSHRDDRRGLEALAKEFGTHPEIARNFTELIDDAALWHDPNGFIPSHNQNQANEQALTDEDFHFVIRAMPNLEELSLIRTKALTSIGIRALRECSKLRKLELAGMPRVRDDGLGEVLMHLPDLRELSLSRMRIEDKSLRDLVQGGSSSKFESLKLVQLERVTDKCIREVVSKCENLKSVKFMYCMKISNSTASHVSCARNINSVVLAPLDQYPISTRAIVHLSCAAVGLHSLILGNCRGIKNDGIVALGNLPGLRKLHMARLGNLTLDSMKALGGFARLENLLLQGYLHLSDLGLKMLCTQRGHRFIHLTLCDESNSLCDEGLDCVMTWCTSLRTLEVSGSFRKGAMERLCEVIPHATVRVRSVVEDSSGFVRGERSVWD